MFGSKFMKKIIQSNIFHKKNQSCMELSVNQELIVQQMNIKISNNNFVFESISCLCGKNTFDLIASVERYGIEQQTVVCKNCGLIQLNPRMSLSNYREFYESDIYRTLYEPKGIKSYTSFYSNNTGQHIFNKINSNFSIMKNQKVIEIGAGGGWNLIPFYNNNMDVMGLDYSQGLVQMGREYGINMIQGGLDKLDGKFDIIIINHVLEHFINPLEDVKKIIEHLNKDGILYIAVPNILNFSIGQIQNAHIYYFTPNLLKYYLSIIGLESVEFGSEEKIHMSGIFKVNNYLSIDITLNDCKNEVYRMLKKISFKYNILRPLLVKSKLLTHMKNIKNLFAR